MPRAADMLGYRTSSQFGAGQSVDRSIPMATPSGEFIPTPPTASQEAWQGALSNPSVASILYGAGETAASLISSPLPYVAGMVGYGYGALTGKDPRETGAQFQQATTLEPKTALGQYYTEQVGDKLSALPPVISGIPTPRIGAGATRYAGQQYGMPMLEKSMTMYEQGKLTPGFTPISQMADDSYRGSHKAPNVTVYGATLDNLGGIMPADVYSSKGISRYGLGDPAVDREWFSAAYRAKNKPDAEVTVWRAVPKGVTDINSGDWVTTSKTYAKNHGENTLNGEYDLISSKVKANTLSSEGYPYEFGYNEPANPVKSIKTEFELAHEAAQRNAALPIEQGGYGLPANNTAMDRARAEGYDMRTYHGSTDSNIKEFDPSMSKGARQRTGIFSSESPELASTYAGNMGGTIYPLMVKSKGMAEVDAAGKNWSRITPDTIIKNADGTEVPAKDIITSLYAENTNTNDIARYARQQLNTGVKFKNISDIGAMSRWSGDVPETATNVTVFKPENIRSRFAAFDPMKKTSKDILAGTAAGAIGLSALMSESDQPEDVFSILYK